MHIVKNGPYYGPACTYVNEITWIRSQPGPYTLDEIDHELYSKGGVLSVSESVHWLL